MVVVSAAAEAAATVAVVVVNTSTVQLQVQGSWASCRESMKNRDIIRTNGPSD